MANVGFTAFAAITIGLVLLGLPGCGTGPRFQLPPDAQLVRAENEATEVRLRADWDDVGPAVRVALPAAELTALSSSAPEEGVRIYTLRGVGGEPGELRVARLEDGGDSPPQIVARARIGRFGDPEHEARFLTALASRLAALRGVEYAPLR